MKQSDFEKIITLQCDIICEIYEHIGKGNAKLMDEIATKYYDQLYHILNTENIRVLSLEGERDGIFCGQLQKSTNCQLPDVQISLDPIDGTKACACGESRGITALAIDTKVEKLYKRIPDLLSCFCIASHDRDVAHIVMDDLEKGTKNLWKTIGNDGVVSSIHRSESLEFWEYLGVDLEKRKEGESRLTFANLLFEQLYLAGDTSIPLFLESQYFIGRVGASEAVMESRLWENWIGALVSSKQMRSYPSGQVAYLRDRMMAAQMHDISKIEQFFTQEEIQALYNSGWSKEEMISPIIPDDFSPDFSLIVIGSITGLIDSKFTQHSKLNLDRAVFKDNQLCTDFWIKWNGHKELMQCNYNKNNRKMIWKKKN